MSADDCNLESLVSILGGQQLLEPPETFEVLVSKVPASL